jgi:Protein of unknown function (DUF692)
LPLPYTDETLRVVAAHLAEVQDVLGREYVIENPSTYVSLDELIGVYLADSASDAFPLRQEDVWLEVRGLRGTLEMHRLTKDGFPARASGRPTGECR